MIRNLLKWVFKSELEELNKKIEQANNAAKTCDSYSTHIKNILSNIDISVDVHEYDHKYSPSWAVISLQGQKTDYIKFMNLGDRDINEIAKILRQFERSGNIKIDAAPNTSRFLKVNKDYNYAKRNL